jgi:hypothetical protein
MLFNYSFDLEPIPLNLSRIRRERRSLRIGLV